MFFFNDITFRAVEERDLQTLVVMRCDEEINEQLFTLYPISYAGQKKWLEQMLNNDRNKVFMVEANVICPDSDNVYNTTIGCVRLTNIDHVNKKVEIGADIIAEFRGQGLGKKIYTALSEYCFLYLGMHQLYLYVLSSNLKAIGCYESAGFELIATLKDWVFKKGYQNVRLYAKYS